MKQQNSSVIDSDAIDELDLDNSFSPDSEDGDIYVNGVDEYDEMNSIDRRTTRKQIRKFRTRF
jgi:hypothetical protein